ncbi:MAG TPA: hypothetical protein DCS07_06660 [Bdellovibrionales bacterium]|nr:MAG: hypothetical protein A2Z97_09170 [Bdellovibrionales bacterium GWB1_52_6]OFZ32802.1 MAG: hypothetical protein A2070_12340 [Bdellovibrionales bacterium GWC1_52_8]HAR42299.1 hypothetical protein [Bdellovibrionales bacterium]
MFRSTFVQLKCHVGEQAAKLRAKLAIVLREFRTIVPGNVRWVLLNSQAACQLMPESGISYVQSY